MHLRLYVVIAMTENMAVYVLQTEFRFLYWKFDIVRSLYINASFHHLHCVSSINVYSFLCLTRQEESSPK